MREKRKALKIFSVFVFLSVFTFPVLAQTSGDIPIEVKKLTDRIMLIKTGETSVLTNVLAISTERGIVVFDATWLPGLARRMKTTIEKEFGREDFAYLVLTHAGFDHTSGNQAFTEATIIGHDIVPARMQANIGRIREPETFFGRAFQNAKKALQDVVKGSQEEKERTEFVDSYTILINETSSQDFVITPPDITFSDRMNLHFADLTLRMVHNIESYSDNDIITYIPELKLLNVGDIFNNDRLPWISPRSDIPRWLEIFEEFTDKEKEIDYVIGGHGGLMTMAEIKDFLDYAGDLWDALKTAKKQGLTLQDVEEKFSFENFNHVTHINPVMPGWGIDMHRMNVRNIWRMLEN